MCIRDRYREVPGVGPFADGMSKLPEGFNDDLHHGSNWIVLARDACERLNALHSQPALAGPFRYSLQADDTYALARHILGKGPRCT